MHRGDDHSHDRGGSAAAFRANGAAPIGHNGQAGALQWQTPHLPESRPPATEETDLDLVAAAFVEGFLAASDPTSFLRLARVPFEATDTDGSKLALLRVEIDTIADVGSIMPHLGGASFRYDPLPTQMVSRRKHLRLVYFDGHGLRTFDLSDAIKLSAP